MVLSVEEQLIEIEIDRLEYRIVILVCLEFCFLVFKSFAVVPMHSLIMHTVTETLLPLMACGIEFEWTRAENGVYYYSSMRRWHLIDMTRANLPIYRLPQKKYDIADIILASGWLI